MRQTKPLSLLLAAGGVILLLIRSAAASGDRDAAVAGSSAPTLPVASAPAAVPANPDPHPVSAVAGPDLRVEYFGAERGYALGTQDVRLLCVVRNIGSVSLPEKALRLRCYAIAGLDYTTGETVPTLPALSPNQAVAFRWRFTPTEATGSLIAALFVENAGPTPVAEALPGPRAVLAVIPRLSHSPFEGGAAPKNPLPTARANASASEAEIGNSRVLAQFRGATGQKPMLTLAGREGDQWRELAVGLPEIKVLAGEDGQVPWWEVFHWQASSAEADHDVARLTLSGAFGTRWHGELEMESRRDTGVLDCRLRLTARRAMRLFGLQLPALMARPEDHAPALSANGAPDMLSPEDSKFTDTDRVAATCVAGSTFGIAWPESLPLAGWKWSRLPYGDSDRQPILGVQAAAGIDRGDVISQGATLVFPFRLFVLTPSDTARDALRFVMP